MGAMLCVLGHVVGRVNSLCVRVDGGMDGWIISFGSWYMIGR